MEVTIPPRRIKTPPMRLRTKGATALVSALIADHPTKRLVTTAVHKGDATPDRLADRFAPRPFVGRLLHWTITLFLSSHSILAGLASQYLTNRVARNGCALDSSN